MGLFIHQSHSSENTKLYLFRKTYRDAEYFLQFGEILLSRLPLEFVHLCLPLFLRLFLTVFETLSLSPSSPSSALPPSLSFSLSSAFPNTAAKLLFPSHYLICASPLSCKSSRYSSLFSINSTAVKLQLPITKRG